ncbi:MAG: helix-turn-helix domain-containing protein, partial [Vicinamibacterales bacterium]
KARRLAAGVGLSELAKAANCSDWLIKQLEQGGNCSLDEAARILAALIPAKSLTSSTADDPCVITAAGHGLQTGDEIVIAGHAGTTPTINGTRVVTRIDADSFSIPVDTAGGEAGAGGTATATLTSLGLARL